MDDVCNALTIAPYAPPLAKGVRRCRPQDRAGLQGLEGRERAVEAVVVADLSLDNQALKELAEGKS